MGQFEEVLRRVMNPEDDMHRCRYSCSHCGYFTVQPKHLQSHSAFFHKEQAPPTPTCSSCLKTVSLVLKPKNKQKKSEHPWICDECPYININLCHLNTHKRKVHKSKKLLERKCDRSCKTNSSVGYELKEHARYGKGITQCSLCDFNANSKDDLTLHRKTHHNIVCKFCGHKSLYIKSYEMHIAMMHTKAARKETNSFEIFITKEVGTTSGDDNETETSNDILENKLEAETTSEEVERKERNSFEMFITKTNIEVGTKVLDNNETVTSNYILENKSEAETTSEEKIGTETLNEIFEVKSEVENRRLEKEFQKNYPCEFCHKRFPSPSKLQRHQLVHLPKLPPVKLATKQTKPKWKEEYEDEKRNLSKLPKLHFVPIDYLRCECGSLFKNKEPLARHMALCWSVKKKSYVDFILGATNKDKMA